MSRALSPKVRRERALLEVRKLVARLGVQEAYADIFARQGKRIDALENQFRSPRSGRVRSGDALSEAIARDRIITRYVNLAKALRSIEYETARSQKRGPDLDKLSWMASFDSLRGRDALAVLQDALLEQYPRELEEAQRTAQRLARKHRKTFLVSFLTNTERAIRAYGKRGPSTPFDVHSKIGFFRQHVPIVWDTAKGYDTHRWVHDRRIAAAEEEERRIRRLQERRASQ